MIQYTVDNSNNDVVIHWTMTGIHDVPDRQQYFGLRQVHTLYRIDNSMIGTHQLHLANADMIPGVVPDRQQYVRLDRVSNDGYKSCRGLRIYSQALLWNSASCRRRVRALRSLSALSPISFSRSVLSCNDLKPSHQTAGQSGHPDLEATNTLV